MAKLLRLVGALLAALTFVVAPVTAPRAGAQSPAPPPGLTMTVEPLLGGSFRPGSWMAVRVGLENHGPAIAGELRLAATLSFTPVFSVAVDLPTGARQEHLLYGQLPPITARYKVELVSAEAVVHTVNVALQTRTDPGVRAYVIAERPERLVGGLNSALDQTTDDQPVVVSMAASALPPLPQAWSSIDLLVWQDGDTQALDGQRIEALRTWLVGGGSLLIVAGSAGVSGVSGFPDDLLPFKPERTIDVVPDDLADFAPPPPGAAATAGLTGILASGSAIASAGDAVIAARNRVGRGSVTVLGIDPTTPWMADSTFGAAVWTRALPPALAPNVPAQLPPEFDFGGADDFIVNALANIPAARLPELTHLVALLAAYVVAIGPLNYFLLRRGRRELAWLTMPVTIAIFALGAYLLGVSVRGPNVVVNQLAVVRGAAGAERGMAEVYVGVFSPGRASYDVTVGGGALVSMPSRGDFAFDRTAQPRLQVRQGDPSTVSNFDVSFGSLRAFTALAGVPTPRIDTDLRIEGDALTGTLTNASTETLSAVSVVYGGATQHLGDLAPGETRTVGGDWDPLSSFSQASDRLVPRGGADDPGSLRVLAARRAIIDHLDGGWASGQGFDFLAQQLSAAGPTIIAFHSTPALQVGVGGPVDEIGESMFMLAARAAITGQISMTGTQIARNVVAQDSPSFFMEGSRYHLGRGTLSVDYRLAGIDGGFRPTGLQLRFGTLNVPATGDPQPVEPLPADQQPDPDAPLAVSLGPDEINASYPRVQLLDVVQQTWVELMPMESGRTYALAEPSRWLDPSGTLRVRFVVRDTPEVSFVMGARIEGTVE